MPTLKAKVDVTNHFQQIKRNINEIARVSVEHAAIEGAQAAAAIASQRSKTGRMASIRAGNATRTADGWVASFVSPVYYAWFQNYGTLGNRRKSLKQPARGKRSRDPGTGIEPLRFLEAGRAAGRRALLATIARGLPR